MAAHPASNSTPTTLASQSLRARALKRTLETVDAKSCPRSYNFHMHTVYSDGRLQPEMLMQQAIDIGLKGLAITDHHSIGGYYAARRWLEDWQWNPPSQPVPELWVGVEINGRLIDNEVHILAYAFDPDHPVMSPYLRRQPPQAEDSEAGQIIQAIHQARGIAVLAHPVRYRRSPEELITEAATLGIDGVEAYYAYNNPTPWRPSPDQTSRVLHLSDRHQLLVTCGTDTHGLSILQRL